MINETEIRLITIDGTPHFHNDMVEALSTLYPLSPNNLHFSIESAESINTAIEKITQATETAHPYSVAFCDLNFALQFNTKDACAALLGIDDELQLVIYNTTWDDIPGSIANNSNVLLIKSPLEPHVIRQLVLVLSSKWLLSRQSKLPDQLVYQNLREQAESLEQSLIFLRSTLDSAQGGMMVTDKSHTIVDNNRQLGAILNLTVEQLKQSNADYLLDSLRPSLNHPEQFIHWYNSIKEQFENKSQAILKFKNGKIVECNSTPHRLNNEIIGRLWCFYDITEQSFLQEKLIKQALHDPLTQLPNRILLNDRIQQAIAKAHRENTLFAVIFLDLDRFKLVNDSLSHSAGDELLKQVADRLSQILRQEDTLARLGGDEFVMIIPQLQKEKYAITVAQKIIHAFIKPFVIQGHHLNLGTSIGISLYPQDGETVNTLLSHADLAMYSSKESGGNQFKFYTEHLNKQTKQRIEQEIELSAAIENDQFYLVYQPELEMASGQVCSVEALLRWQHPKKGVVLPLDFIPAAEDSGLIVAIGEWILNAVCQQINSWREQGLPFLRVAVNVSIYQLKQENFADVIQQILNKHAIPAEFLEIEITENIIINNSHVMDMIKKIKKIGANIVLDDFGAVTQSFNYLNLIKFDRLKIDQGFIQNIEHSGHDKNIIESIISMARTMDFQVSAEGVETKKQINFLQQQQCDGVQGNYLSKPLSPEEIVKFYRLMKS